jgi:hypothetical protein
MVIKWYQFFFIFCRTMDVVAKRCFLFYGVSAEELMKIQITIEMISSLVMILYFTALFTSFHKRNVSQFVLLSSFVMLMCMGLMIQWYVQLISMQNKIKKIHASIK